MDLLSTIPFDFITILVEWSLTYVAVGVRGGGAVIGTVQESRLVTSLFVSHRLTPLMCTSSENASQTVLPDILRTIKILRLLRSATD